MSTYFKQHNQLLLNIGGFAINLMPFLLYLMLVSRHGDVVIDALPFALFYAFRRTALFAVRGAHDSDNLLGWIGLAAALSGFAIGIFGECNSIWWNLSAMGAGIGAAFFPSVQKQFRLTHRQSPADQQKENAWIMLFSFIGLIALLTLTERRWPALSFAALLLFALVGLIGFYYDPLRHPGKTRITISVPNLVLAVLLFCSVFLVRIGRSLGTGQPAIWGIGLLALIVVAIIAAALSNRPHPTATPWPLKLRLMLFGLCADFCAIFSAVYIGVTYGIKTYAWMAVAYLLAFIIGGRLVKGLCSRLPFTTLTTELLGIIAGLLLTFNFYTYFVGIFLIRAFASVQNQEAIREYDQQSTANNSYMVSYRLMSIAGLTTQLILWLSLLLAARLTGFSAILADFTFHQPTTRFARPLLITQVVLAVWMLLFIFWIYRANQPKEENDDETQPPTDHSDRQRTNQD